MAATDLEKLVVQLSADIKNYENALKRAQGVTNRQMGAMQRQAQTSSKAIAGSFIAAGAKIAAAFVAADTVRGAIRLSESATRIDNALKVAGLSGKELEDVFNGLYTAAQKNGAPIESLATLYSKVALSQKELGVSTEDLKGFTDNVALAMRVAGTDAVTASGALTQLGQALGSGKVQAEEFNSILDGTPTIVQAVAAGLKEAGGSVARLKQLIVDEKISSEAFFRAFEAGSVTLEQKAANSTFTIAQAATNLNTALVKVAREFNNSTGASQRFAGGINTAAEAIGNFDVSGLIQKIRDARAELDGFVSDLGNAEIFKKLNELLGVTDSEGNVINLDAEAAKDETASLEAEVKTLQDRIKLNTSLGFDNTEAMARLAEVGAQLNAIKAAAANLPATIEGYSVVPGEGVVADTGSTYSGPPTRGGKRRKPTVTPVSVTDFKPPPGKGGGGGRKRGGGGGGSENDLQREIQQIRERTAAIQAETTAMAGLNPLVDDYGYSVEFASSKQALLTAAQEAGVKITPELTAQIEALAGGYAQASAEAEKLAQSQENTRQMAEDFKGIAKDALGGFISDLRDGKSATEALGNALDRITEKLLDMALNSVFDNIFSGFSIGGGGGGADPWAGLRLAKGGPVHAATGGRISGPGSGTSDSIPAMLSDGEFVVNAAATKKNLAALQAINSGKGLHLATGGFVGRSRAGSVGGAPVMNVKVINNANTTVKQEQRQTLQGPQLAIVIDEIVGDKIGTPGSRSRAAIQGAYNVKPGLARR